MKKPLVGLTIVVLVLATLVAGCQEQTQPTGDGDVGADSSADVDEADSVAEDGALDDAIDVTPDSTADATPDASDAPELLDISDLHYVGAFRVPASEFGASSMHYSEAT